MLAQEQMQQLYQQQMMQTIEMSKQYMLTFMQPSIGAQMNQGEASVASSNNTGTDQFADI